MKLRKAISYVSLSCVAASIILGILLILKVVKGNDLIGQIYLSLLTIFTAGLFMLNCLESIKAKNKLGYVCFGMLSLSAILFLVMIWGFRADLFIRITVWFAMISIFLDLMISNYITLGKNFLVFQIIYFVVAGYVLLSIGMTASGVSFFIVDHIKMFAIFCIIFVGLFITLKFLGKGISKEEVTKPENKENMVTITVEEYEGLKAKIAELEAKLAENN